MAYTEAELIREARLKLGNDSALAHTRRARDHHRRGAGHVGVAQSIEVSAAELDHAVCDVCEGRMRVAWRSRAKERYAWVEWIYACVIVCVCGCVNVRVSMCAYYLDNVGGPLEKDIPDKVVDDYAELRVCLEVFGVVLESVGCV